MVVASTEGGMSVEEISKEKSETIIRSKIEVAVGMQQFQAREIAFGLGIEPKLIRRAALRFGNNFWPVKKLIMNQLTETN